MAVKRPETRLRSFWSVFKNCFGLGFWFPNNGDVFLPWIPAKPTFRTWNGIPWPIFVTIQDTFRAHRVRLKRWGLR
jgi:hypothetical protein